MLSRRTGVPARAAVSVPGMHARLSALLLVLLALAACGRDDDAADRGAATPSPSPVASASPSPAGPSPAPSAAPTVAPSAAPPASPSRAASPPLPTTLTVPRPTRGGPGRLTGDGLALPNGVVAFGDALATARPTVDRFLGRPTRDTGVIAAAGDYGTCPGEDLRVLEYDGGALQLFFGTRPGATAMTLFSWRLTRASTRVPPASALVGDVTTFELRPGTTVAELQRGAGDAVVVSDDELVGPSFRVEDQSAGLFGTLSEAGPQGVVRTVQGGVGCE